VVQAGDWAHPLTPFRRGGCSDKNCIEGWTTKIDWSYGSLSDPSGGSVVMEKCRVCNGDDPA
jgi:hypothetical protein